MKVDDWGEGEVVRLGGLWFVWERDVVLLLLFVPFVG